MKWCECVFGGTFALTGRSLATYREKETCLHVLFMSHARLSTNEGKHWNGTRPLEHSTPYERSILLQTSRRVLVAATETMRGPLGGRVSAG